MKNITTDKSLFFFFSRREILFLLLLTILFSIMMAFIYFSIWKTMNPVNNDAKGYLKEAHNLIFHSTVSSIQRSPGYPAFLALVFHITNIDNFKAILIAHLLLRIFICILAVLLVFQNTNSFIYAFFTCILLWSPALMSQTRYIYTETLSAFAVIGMLFFYNLSVLRGYSIIYFLLSSFFGILLALTSRLLKNSFLYDL